MSTWLDLDKSDDESLSSSNEFYDHTDSLAAHMKNLHTNLHVNIVKSDDTAPPDTRAQNKLKTVQEKAGGDIVNNNNNAVAAQQEAEAQPQPKTSYIAPKKTLSTARNPRAFKSKSMTLPTSFRPVISEDDPNTNNNTYYSSTTVSQKATSKKKKKLKQQGDGQPLKRTYSYPLPDSEPFCVWLGNLPAEAKPRDIVAYLEPLQIQPRDIRFGRIHKNKYTCAYVDFYNKEDMKTALGSIDCSAAPLFMGRQVEIDINEGIVVDRQAAVTCTSSSSSLNSPFRPQAGGTADGGGGSRQDVRYSSGGSDKKHQKHLKGAGQKNHVKEQQAHGAHDSHNLNANQQHMQGAGDYYADKRDRYHSQSTFSRNRRGSNHRGARGGRDRSYFRGQYGHYRQKNGANKYMHSHSHSHSPSQSSPAFASFSSGKLTHSPTKPIKILQRPKQREAVSQNNSSSGSSSSKSRFPTLDEANKGSKSQQGQAQESSAISAASGDYISSAQGGVDNINGADNYHHSSSYYSSSKSNKRHINNATFNLNNAAQQQTNQTHVAQAGGAHSYQSYKQKRHRNRSHSDRSGHDYYGNNSYKRDSYRMENRDRDTRDHYNSYGSSNKSYSKKRHNYGY